MLHCIMEPDIPDRHHLLLLPDDITIQSAHGSVVMAQENVLS